MIPILVKACKQVSRPFDVYLEKKTYTFIGVKTDNLCYKSDPNYENANDD